MVNLAAGLSGTWSLIRGDADWDARLPMDASAVFGSFWAIPLSFPAIALATEAARRATAMTPEAAEIVAGVAPVPLALSAVVSSVFAWVFSLLVLTRLAARGGKGWRVSPLIVAYDWSRLIVNLVVGLAAVATLLTGALPLMIVASLAKAGLTIWFDIVVIRRSLDLAAGQTAGALAMVMVARLVAVLLGDLVLGAASSLT